MTAPIFIIASRLRALFLVVSARSSLHVLVAVAVASYFQHVFMTCVRSQLLTQALLCSASGSFKGFIAAAGMGCQQLLQTATVGSHCQHVVLTLLG